jgi:predicted MFS family arabinose efflux permease
LTAARWIGGFGTGCTEGACYLVYGQSHREQNQAIYSIGQLSLAFVVILIAPAVIAAFGWRSLFLGFALLTVPALFQIRFFTSAVRAPLEPSGRVRTPLGVRVWFALAGVAMFFLGQGALWAFLETIGEASGFPAATVNTAMTVCSAFGAMGPIVVLLLAGRVKPVVPLVGSVAMTLVALSCIQSRSPWIYGASISMFYFCLSIFAAYQFGVVAAAETSGRAAVLMSSATAGGFSVAAYVGGQLVEHVGYPGLRLFDAIMMVAALSTLLALIRKPPRSSVPG